MYKPSNFGCQGGDGGDGVSDYCHPKDLMRGGTGGGIVQLKADTRLHMDGEILCDGGEARGERGGGGAGGSVFMDSDNLSGAGRVLARGGKVPAPTVREDSCSGGGGGGGRVTLRYNTSTFTGMILAHGGDSDKECGGAGTILKRDKFKNEDRVVINYQHLCKPLTTDIQYEKLDDVGDHRGRDSFRTWLFDPQHDEHDHSFAEVDIRGGAHLALYRRNIDTFKQRVTVQKTSGDKSGMFHIGPLQVIHKAAGILNLKSSFCSFKTFGASIDQIREYF